MTVAVALEDSRAPIITIAVCRGFHREYDIIAQAYRATKIEQVGSVVIGGCRTFSFYRGKEPVPQLRDLLDGVGSEKALKVLQAFFQRRAWQAPGKGEREQGQEKAYRGKLPPHNGRDRNAANRPFPLPRVQMRTDDEYQGKEQESEELAVKRLVPAEEYDIDQEDQPRRQNHSPDAIQAKDMPVRVIRQEPE